MTEDRDPVPTTENEGEDIDPQKTPAPDDIPEVTE